MHAACCGPRFQIGLIRIRLNSQMPGQHDVRPAISAGAVAFSGASLALSVAQQLVYTHNPTQPAARAFTTQRCRVSACFRPGLGRLKFTASLVDSLSDLSHVLKSTLARFVACCIDLWTAQLVLGSPQPFSACRSGVTPKIRTISQAQIQNFVDCKALKRRESNALASTKS